jgi:hypothetical protein
MEATAATPTEEEVKSPAEEAAELLSDEGRGPEKVKTADALKARAIHRDVVLPSGAIVDVRIPNLPQMVKSGKIPNELVDAAIKHQTAEAITREILEETWDFTRFIVPRTLVTPEITEDDVEGMDALDIELLVNMASRRADTDAVGRQLGGLDTQEKFRNFRDVLSLRAALGGV